MAKLTTYIDRAERLMKEASDANDALKEVLEEAKDDGFEPAIIRKVAKTRLKGEAKKLANTIELIKLYGSHAGLQLTLDLPVAQSDGRKERPAKPEGVTVQ